MLLLPLIDLAWNLTHLNIGLVDFFGLANFARGWATNHAWPATPYFPVGYPLLLAPFGLLGEMTSRGGVLQGGYLLSAFGGILVLAGVLRLARHWGLRPWAAGGTVLLVWLSPEMRITSGSPAPDLLATGAAVCFLALACEAWDGLKDGRANLAAALAAAAACALRYHFLLLVLPVAVVLLWRRQARQTALGVLLAVGIAFAINHGLYFSQYREPLRSAALTQLRTGLCFRFGRPYSSPADLFQDYQDFAEHCQRVPLLREFSVAELAQHISLNWLQYMRRPGILLGLLLGIMAWRGHGMDSRKTALFVLPLFTLVLSPAYFVPRAALFPVCLGVATALASAEASLPRRWFFRCLVVSALLLCGYVVASRFALADYRLRAASSQANRALPATLSKLGLGWDTTGILSGYIIRLDGDPWLSSRLHIGNTWMEDPAIRQNQVPSRRIWSLERVAQGAEPELQSIVTYERGESYQEWVEASRGCWKIAAEVHGAEVWMPVEP